MRDRLIRIDSSRLANNIDSRLPAKMAGSFLVKFFDYSDWLDAVNDSIALSSLAIRS
jgi:hypothetical protein